MTRSDAMARASSRMREAPRTPKRVDIDKPYGLRPGALRGESTVIVKTRKAQLLVFGRHGSKGGKGLQTIIGLVGFAGMLKTICTGVKLDDPYADQWLLKIEEAIDSSAEKISVLRGEIEQALSRRSDFNHTVAHSTEPLEVPLFFSSQIAFKAAYLINDFDNLVCAALTAKHVAIMTAKSADNYMRGARKAVRRALITAGGYQYTGVSRADFVHNTAKARAAVDKWGALPEEVLNGSRRAPSAPPLPERSFARERDSNSVDDRSDQ